MTRDYMVAATGSTLAVAIDAKFIVVAIVSALTAIALIRV